MTTQTLETTATTWRIDPSHTSVEFAVKHMVITTVKGRFSQVDGTILLDETDMSRSSVTAQIEAASIDTREAQRDEHLQSADFLDVATHPTLSFRSTRVIPRGGDRYEVLGELTIRGATREVLLDATFAGTAKDPWGGTRVAFSGTTAINRRDFGLTWNAALESGGLLVGDEVKISLEIQAVLQES